MPNPVDRLSRAEKDALRLVASDRRAGEIARILGKSPNTVENQIKSARAKLGGVPGIAAARMLAEAEGRSHSLASLASVIEPDNANLQSSSTDRAAGVAEGRAIFELDAPPAPEPEDRPTRVTRSLSARLLLIALGAALLSAVVILALASVYVFQLISRTS